MAKERKFKLIVFSTCEDPYKITESWKYQILKLGGSAMGIPKMGNFGIEKWMLDPEGNQLLILVHSLTGESEKNL